MQKDISLIRNRALVYSRPFPEGTQYTKVNNHTHPVEKNAIDFIIPAGTDILSRVEDAEVYMTGKCDIQGIFILLIDKENKVLIDYAHLLEGSILVEKGDILNLKQKIAESGNTGNSTAPHLHLNHIKDGKSIKVKFKK
jgi:murein DD-endopeptidase MepM/ murein hydrolase activator NlpD